VNSLAHADAEIVIIDDDPSVVRLLSRALQSAGYQSPQGFTDPLEASFYLESHDPDLITLDICMPGLDGYGLLEALDKKRLPDATLPVLAISGLGDFEARERAVRAGAKDFLVKPVSIQDFLLHVYSLLDARFIERRLSESRDVLEGLVRDGASGLGQAYVESIERLGRLAELRDDATGKHTYRVAHLSALLAQTLCLAHEEIELIRRAAPLHDVGKVAIEDRILLKKGALSSEEAEIMRGHARVGAQLLGGGHSDLMKMAEQIAISHHERWDGEGYPCGLAGDEIPLCGRIVAVADAFDAITHARPYKEAYSSSHALAEIERESGRQFDPRVVGALMRVERAALPESESMLPYDGQHIFCTAAGPAGQRAHQ
jgi:putative two-component system response regulator